VIVDYYTLPHSVASFTKTSFFSLPARWAIWSDTFGIYVVLGSFLVQIINSLEGSGCIHESLFFII